MDFKKRPLVEYKFNDDMTVKPVHFQNIKILWKADGMHAHGENITFPANVETAPTVEKINNLKKKISELLPEEFPMRVLDREYARLEHPDEQCEYNSSKVLEDMRYVLESYGHRSDVEPMDGFFSKDVDYSERYTDL